MKLMTYNIFDGGSMGLDRVQKVIKSQNPDFLSVNEANTFSEEKIIKSFANNLNFPYYSLSLSGEYDYHVAVFSKSPFKKIEAIKPLKRAALICALDCSFGELSVISTHLAPDSEDIRMDEVKILINEQKVYNNKIIMGDLNSLSSADSYGVDFIKTFNQTQIRKFTSNGKILFNVTGLLEDTGYVDTGKFFTKNNVFTVPTPANKDAAHSPLRLDYIFVSQSLASKLKSYEVVKNDDSDNASDHYPVTINLE